MLMPLLLLAAAADGPAQEPPPALDAMIRESHAKERKTIVNVAKRTYPQSVEAIDALVKRLRARLREIQPEREYLEVLRGHMLRLVPPEQ